MTITVECGSPEHVRILRAVLHTCSIEILGQFWRIIWTFEPHEGCCGHRITQDGRYSWDASQGPIDLQSFKLAHV